MFSTRSLPQVHSKIEKIYDICITKEIATITPDEMGDTATEPESFRR